MPPRLIGDLSKMDLNRVEVDLEGIRKVNPQRFEMEQLTAIVYVNRSEGVIVGYKDVRNDEFWVRGHLPGYPLMPGVLMCEAAAQLCSYYTVTSGLVEEGFFGFGGINDVKFRGPVHPGDRLVIVSMLKEFRPRRRATFATQGLVGDTLVFHGDIIGVPMTTATVSSAVSGAPT